MQRKLRRMPLTCRLATLEEIYDLRWSVLRAGLPRETAVFDGDDGATTLHAGAFDERGGNVACLSLMVKPFEGEPAWQLRGMATHPSWRARGAGRELWLFAEREAKARQPGFIFWCNARESAVGFYERVGWRLASEKFDIAGVGPHVRMVKR
jgi:predicted GNAT family N-acyltransferase